MQEEILENVQERDGRIFYHRFSPSTSYSPIFYFLSFVYVLCTDPVFFFSSEETKRRGAKDR
jgi:hypothetical protein